MELEPKEIQAVQGSFLLADIPPCQAALFAAWGDKQLFEDGQTIYSTGRFRRAVGLLLEGGARIYSPSGDRKSVV